MKIFFLLFLLSIAIPAGAQVKFEADTITMPEEANTIYVHRIAGDSLSTTFLILVEEKVPMHKHDKHSETVVVLEGTASMLLGEENIEIKKGDILFIPAGTWHKLIVTSEVPLKVVSVQAPHFDGTDRIFYQKN